MLDHLADIESDLSAIHRIEDMYQVQAPRFFRLVFRLACYEGVVRMRLRASAPSDDAQSPQPGRRDVEMVPGTPEAIAASPLGRFVRFSTTEALAPVPTAPLEVNDGRG